MIEFKAREPQQNQRSNRQRGYADAGREVLSGSGNGHKPYLLRRKPEGGKHLAARSDQTAAEREREVGSARPEPQLLRTERVYSPFAKTHSLHPLHRATKILRPGAMSAAGD